MRDRPLEKFIEQLFRIIDLNRILQAQRRLAGAFAQRRVEHAQQG